MSNTPPPNPPKKVGRTREELTLEQQRVGCGSWPEAWIPQHTAVGTLGGEPEHR